MKDINSFLIIILLVSASILGIMLYGSTQTASAANSASRSVDNDYVIITGQASGSAALLYVIHVPTRQLAVFVGDRAMGKFQLVDAKRMDTMF